MYFQNHPIQQAIKGLTYFTMAISHSSLSSIPTCYATVSIGTPDTPLDQKLQAIANAGFQGIELGFPDLLSFASKRQNEEVQAQDFDTLCDAGHEVKQMVEKRGLKIVMLQPFSNFEGWEEGSEGREDAFRRAKGWIRIMQAVGTDMLQVNHPFNPEERRAAPCINQQLNRSALPTLHMLLALSITWHPISSNSLTSWPPATSALRTKTGAGLLMRQIGRMFGRLSKRSTGQTWVCV